LFVFFFVGCSDSGSLHSDPQQDQKVDSVADKVNIPLVDPLLVAKCWVQENGAVYGDFVGGKQCTDLARLLTNAPGYGKDAAKNSLGGLEYVNLKNKNSKTYSLLSEVKSTVKECDNLVLFGKGYAEVGHTAVVFSIDVAQDAIGILDQNFDKKGITLRSNKKISEIENNAYVIPSTCKKAIKHESCTLNTPVAIQPLDIVVPSPTVDDSSTRNTLFINAWLLRYDPDKWEAYDEFPEPSAYVKPDYNNNLEHKTIENCFLHSNWDFEKPDYWKKDKSEKVIVGEKVIVEMWINTQINKPELITYVSPYDPMSQLALSGRGEGSLPVPSECIAAVEEMMGFTFMQ
jgi:hypothetical protein